MRKQFKTKPWFFPLPVLMIGTYDEKGNPDIMNAAWGGLYDAGQVVLCLSASHKTTKNIREMKEFTISFGTAASVAACDYVGMVSGNQQPDKVEKAGLHAQKAQMVNAPVFQEFPLSLECRLNQFTDTGQIIADIVGISADDSILDAQGNIDSSKLDLISFDPISNEYVRVGGKIMGAFGASQDE